METVICRVSAFEWWVLALVVSCMLEEAWVCMKLHEVCLAGLCCGMLVRYPTFPPPHLSLETVNRSHVDYFVKAPLRMDVISGVSAVVNVLDVLAGFGLQAQKYIKIMKDAPDTIRNIKSDLEHIDVVLPKLKRELDRPDGGGVLSLSDSEAELNGIVTSLLSLTCEISILLENYKDGISSTKMKAEWALSGKAKAEECGKRLSTLCQALTIVLQFSER